LSSDKIKTKKCHFCKIEDSEDNLIRAEVGDKIKLKKYAHEKCYQNYLFRKSFFELLHEKINFPKLEKDEIIIINTMGKCYGFKIMHHALTSKEQAIIDNMNKGFPYFLGILKNQIRFSEKIIQRQQKEKEFKPKIINEFNLEEIFIKPPAQIETIEKEIEF